MFYTFICNECEERFEVKASISQMANGFKVNCPKCLSDDVRRDYSTINFGTSAGNGAKFEGCSSCSGNKGCCGN